MAWDTATARQLASTGEIDIVVPAPDRPEVRTTIWIVAVDNDLYIRSWKGDAGIWFRRAHRYGTGSIVAAGQRLEVGFTAIGDPETNARVDDAYRSKYGRSSYTQTMTSPPATDTTLRVNPA